MDIYVINTESASNVDKGLLDKFVKKSFSNEEKRIEHSFAYLMLDRILRENYGIKDSELIFKNNKPMLKNKEKCFSLSHSAELLAIAVSDFNCGVDIEKMKGRDYVSIAKRMKLSCSNIKEFYSEWTRYEAKYKLGEQYKATKTFDIEEYMLTAVSANEDETFELYIQI